MAATLTPQQEEKLESVCNASGIQGQRELLWALLEVLMLQTNAAS